MKSDLLEQARQFNLRPIMITNTRRGWSKFFKQVDMYPGDYLVEVVGVKRFCWLTIKTHNMLKEAEAAAIEHITKNRHLVEEAEKMIAELEGR